MGATRLSFGIKTTPMRAGYDEIRRVWREADSLEQIEHAWLWDHFLPLFAPPTDPVLEGWTLLAALAGQTERLGVGLLVTNNSARPPAVLAKMAATTDVISGGRLTLGIGVGGTVQPDGVDNPAVPEFRAYGLPLPRPAEGIARLAEAITIIRRLWRSGPFDFEGQHYRLEQAVCEPKPVQRPGPPLLVGGWGDRTLRLVAESADIWNIPGPPHRSVEHIAQRNDVLNRHCADIGRDPDTIVRSTQMIVSYDDPAASRAAIDELARIGVTHIVLAPLPPYPDGVARWLVDEIIEPAKAAA